MDANVAVLAFGDAPLSEQARAVLNGHDVLVVPDIFFGEVANALARMARVGTFKHDMAQIIYGEIIHLVGAAEPSPPLVESALKLALSLNHGVFDCLYLELAISTLSQLVTADMVFARKIAATPYAPRIISLTDWRA